MKQMNTLIRSPLYKKTHVSRFLFVSSHFHLKTISQTVESNVGHDTTQRTIVHRNQTHDDDSTDFMSQASSYTMYKIGR